MSSISTSLSGYSVLGRNTPQGPILPQVVKPLDLLTGLQTYLAALTNLPDRSVILWCNESRPAIEGPSDWIVWYAPGGIIPDKSEGPVRYGNKIDVKFSVTVSSRVMLDGSNRDSRKVLAHYPRTWYIINALQNLNLFSAYGTSDGSSPPLPTSGAYPLTVEPMYINPQDPDTHDEYEEGTLSTRFSIIVPAVLKLSLV